MTTRTPGGGRRSPEAEERSLIAEQAQPLLERITAPPVQPAHPHGRVTDFVAQSKATVNEDLRQRAQSAVALHIGGKLPGSMLSGASKPIADRFLEMWGDDPQMVAALEADVNTLFALTDEEIAERVARGEKLGAYGDVFDAIAEVSWEVGAAELAARFNAEATDAVSGTFDALTSTEAMQLALEGVGPVAPGQQIRPDAAKAQAFKTLFDVPGAWSYSQAARTLAVTVGRETVGITTGPGFDPANHLDVMAEVVRAQADGRIKGGTLEGGQAPRGVQALIDKAHQVGSFLDTHPGLRRYADTIWQMTGAFMVPGAPLANALRGEGEGPLERASERIRTAEGKITAESVRMASMVPFPEPEIIASIARVFMEENAGVTSKEALQLAGESVSENRDQLRSEFESLTQAEFLEELEAQIEGQSSVGAALEAGMSNVLDVMEKWDLFSQWIGLNVIESAGAFGPRDTDTEEGFRRFREAQEVEFGTTADEYFGLEGGGGDVANLLVGGIFDPTNYLFAGAQGLRVMARKALTDPKYAGIYLKMGRFPHIANQIAGEVGPRSVMSVVGSSVGLDDVDYLDLMKLALDPDATVGQVNAVWARAMTKDWLPNSSAGPVRHKTIEGMGRMLDAVAGGMLSDDAMDDVFKFFAKYNTGRTFRLGENQAMSGFGDLVTQFFPADPNRAGQIIMRAAEARLAAGDDLAMAGAAQTVKEQARRTITEAGGPTRQMLNASDPRAVNQNLRQVEDALTKLPSQGLDDAAAATVRESLERMHRIMSRRVDDARPRLDALKEKQRVAHKQLKMATALEADQAANAARNIMAEHVYRLYDEVAQELNKQFGRDVVPAIPGKKNPLAPDVPVRDWSEIRHGPREVINSSLDKDLSLMMGLSVDDLSLANQAEAMGMFNRSQKVMLPASPYEVMLYQKLGGNEGALRRLSQVFRDQRVKKVMGAVKFGFAINLLLNPLTAGKVTLDETFRFLADTGELGKFLRASAAGLPVIGRGSENLVSLVRRTLGDAAAGPNPWGLQFSRNIGGLYPDDFADYKWVERPARRGGDLTRAQYREQVERWVNGSLLNDRRFREYARWIDQADVLADGTKIPPPEWVEWWERGGEATRPGRADARTTRLTIRDESILGVELTASDAFNIMDNIFERWLELLVDDGQRDLMRRTLLNAAVGNHRGGGALDLVKDAQLLNAVRQVPGLAATKRFGSGAFNVFFGAPAGRRAGVFYEHYYDEAMDILLARHGDRVLTVDKLMEYAKVDRETATYWLRQGSENATVAKLIAETGARTEAQLAARAAAYAERRADDLMYTFHASSLVGRGVEAGMMFPFARAQADFLSWWTDHMFKPMTLNLPAEARARLPGVVRGMVETVERVPVNVRAWAKYSHMVATANNENQSWVDNALSQFTFFPVKFGSEFLTDLMPQFGPLPSWLIDVAIDQGAISEEAAKNLEALFPALAFTEAEDDWFTDVTNRLLPTSRRSLRDLTVGTIRAAYAFVGSDVNTNPGRLGEIVNALADDRLPAATGDFQAALAADFLKENMWKIAPGTDEWDRAVAALAVSGAVEANKQEWGQDFLDRIYPLAGYDAEYRALRAFEGLFDDQRFQAMANAGIFQTNDLLDRDGQPRIKAVWDSYLEGSASPEDLAWLDDRLTTAYFNAGRVDVLPGFSYMDYLHLSNPELAVNLINKSEDSGIPVRSSDHADFKAAYINKMTGRVQNVPPGEEGRELIADARRRGWLVSRPVEEWMTDASEAVHKSAQRALRGVWERVSHRTWAQGLKKSIEDKTFTLAPKEALILSKTGLDVEAGASFTYGEFHALLDDFDERFKVVHHTPSGLQILDGGAVHKQLARHDDQFGQGLLDMIDDAVKVFEKAGYESVDDWPEASRAEVRRLFSESISLGYTTEKDYAQEIEPIFGPLNYEPPVPPPVDGLESGMRLTGDELADLEVIDGDGVTVLFGDGPLRVRFVGINAPEVTQEGYQEARSNLEELIAGADEVVIGIYKPELFGLTQLSAPGERRLLAWLYVDGVPIYDPATFTADNPRGAGVGGNVLDLQAILEAGR